MAPTSSWTGGGLSLLGLAVETGMLEVVRLLLRTGLTPNWEAQDSELRQTSLHVAVRRGLCDKLKLLLDSPSGMALNLDDYMDESPLAVAVYHGKLKACVMLIEAGADVRGDHSNSMETPLMVAVIRRRVDLVSLLLENGSDPLAGVALHNAVCLAAKMMDRVGFDILEMFRMNLGMGEADFMRKYLSS